MLSPEESSLSYKLGYGTGVVTIIVGTSWAVGKILSTVGLLMKQGASPGSGRRKVARALRKSGNTLAMPVDSTISGGYIGIQLLYEQVMKRIANKDTNSDDWEIESSKLSDDYSSVEMVEIPLDMPADIPNNQKIFDQDTVTGAIELDITLSDRSPVEIPDMPISEPGSSDDIALDDITLDDNISSRGDEGDGTSYSLDISLDGIYDTTGNTHKEQELRFPDVGTVPSEQFAGALDISLDGIDDTTEEQKPHFPDIRTVLSKQFSADTLGIPDGIDDTTGGTHEEQELRFPDVGTVVVPSDYSPVEVLEISTDTPRDEEIVVFFDFVHGGRIPRAIQNIITHSSKQDDYNTLLHEYTDLSSEMKIELEKKIVENESSIHSIPDILELLEILKEEIPAGNIGEDPFEHIQGKNDFGDGTTFISPKGIEEEYKKGGFTEGQRDFMIRIVDVPKMETNKQSGYENHSSVPKKRDMREGFLKKLPSFIRRFF